jgi:hypothetical protein
MLLEEAVSAIYEGIGMYCRGWRFGALQRCGVRNVGGNSWGMLCSPVVVEVEWY